MGAHLDTASQEFTLLHKMHKSGMTANVVSFSAAISACEKGAGGASIDGAASMRSSQRARRKGRWEQALTLLPIRDTGMRANIGAASNNFNYKYKHIHKAQKQIHVQIEI